MSGRLSHFVSFLSHKQHPVDQASLSLKFCFWVIPYVVEDGTALAVESFLKGDGGYLLYVGVNVYYAQVGTRV